MKNLKHKKQSGSSFIEAIICIFLISVMLVLYGASLQAVAMTRKLRNENIGYHVANKQMEALRGTIYGNLPASGTISDPLLAQIPSGAGSYTVANYPGYGNMKQITVTVTWNDGVAKQVELKTLAGTGGINP